MLRGHRPLPSEWERSALEELLVGLTDQISRMADYVNTPDQISYEWQVLRFRQLVSEAQADILEALEGQRVKTVETVVIS